MGRKSKYEYTVGRSPVYDLPTRAEVKSMKELNLPQLYKKNLRFGRNNERSPRIDKKGIGTPPDRT